MTATDKASELPHLTNYLKDLYHCSDCGYCVDAIWEERDIDHICATLESHSPGLSYSGQGYIKTARAWVEGEDLPLASVSEHAFTCTSCGNCERICPIGMRPMEINRALRSELIARDLAPESAVAIQKNVLEQQNPAGAPRAERYHWAQNIETAERAELVYLPGCASAYARPQEAQAAMRLLQAAGVPVKILGDSDSCCGAPLRELGFSDDAARQSEQPLTSPGSSQCSLPSACWTWRQVVVFLRSGRMPASRQMKFVCLRSPGRGRIRSRRSPAG